MKKILSFITLSVILIFNCFSENGNKRLNLGVDVALGIVGSDFGAYNNKGTTITDIGIYTEYISISDSKFILGAFGEIKISGPNYYESIGGNTVDCYFSGVSFQIAPVLGKAFGKKNNFYLLFQPLMLDFVNLYEVNVGSLQFDVDYDYTTFKSGAKMNLTWDAGSLMKIGFYAGLNIVWMSNGYMKNSAGAELSFGNKITFAF